MTKVFITSNMQLGRQSAIGKWKRPFANVDSMTDQLIKNWNEAVGDFDTVYHLGNFAWDPKTAYDSILKLKGKTIFMIVGENDQPILDLQKKGTLPGKVKIISPNTIIDTLKISVNYWPIQEWPKKSKKYFSVIGYPNRKYKTIPKKRIINCSVEQCNYKPQDINSLIELLKEIT